MISRLKLKFPLFEIAVIATMIGVGWALFSVYGLLDDLTRQRFEPAPRPEARQVAQVRRLVELRDRYLALNDRINTGLRLMREGLDAFVKDRTVTVGRYVREADNFQRRLAEPFEPPESDETRKLDAELLTNSIVRADSKLAADLDFRDLLGRVTRAVSNHIAALNITEAPPLTPDIAQRKISQATNTENAVLALVAVARERASRIDGVLERKSVDLVTPAQPASWAARAIGRQSTLQIVLRLLAAVFLLQAIIVIVAFYRRLVVVPLHQRIIENTATAEFQRKLDHFARLASGLAHEIRNPLTAINIRLFTLQKSLPPRGSQHADTVLIRNEIDRLDQILKNFLRLARPSEPRLARLTAHSLLDETRNLLSEQCRQQGVDLRIEKTTDTPFLGDSVQLKQVLINLVQNAAESIEGTGSVTLRAYDERGQNGRATDRSVVLEIEDTGCGITPDVQERLFDPFFSTKDNGTGLGLPIAAKIVDQHKGRLEFASRADHGATFRVILPVEGGAKLNA